MATSSKKKKSVTIPKKRASGKKRTSKRKNKKSKSMKRNIFIVFGLLFMIVLIGIGYSFGKNSHLPVGKIEQGEIEGAYTTQKLLEDLSKSKLYKQERQTKVKHKKPKPQKLKVKHKIQKRKPVVVKKKVSPESAVSLVTKKARLVIIIDDISRQSQLNAIYATGLRLTPSIFPPSELSMTSNHLADGLKHCMIHLPMESGSRQFNSQYKTLMTFFGKQKIEERAEELRRLFPKVTYINNHTGSVFTKNKKAMMLLYSALKKRGFRFIDSRTTGDSKVAQIAHHFGDIYISRDIFIDNYHTVSYIHKQLKKAVKIAKRRGYAIAIGHPHRVTMEALASANNILKDVEIVYIDTFYKSRRSK